MTKRCTRCKQGFTPVANERRCARCIEYSRSYYEQHKERELARHAEWAEKNRGYLAAYQHSRRKRPRIAEKVRAYDQQRAKDPRRKGHRVVYSRKWHYANAYSLTIAEYETMHAAQNGCCAICGDAHALLHVDHCHKSGKVRSLLCGHCNRGIGCFRESPDRMRAAARYIATHMNFQ